MAKAQSRSQLDSTPEKIASIQVATRTTKGDATLKQLPQQQRPCIFSI